MFDPLLRQLHVIIKKSIITQINLSKTTHRKHLKFPKQTLTRHNNNLMIYKYIQT